MHAKQLVGSETSAEDKHIKKPSQACFWRCASIYFVTELEHFISMLNVPLRGRMQLKYRAGGCSSRHGMLQLDDTCAGTFQAY